MILFAENGTQYSLHRPQTTIGRSPNNDILLDSSTVSGAHAIIRRDGAAYLLSDVGSSNGTFVNGEQISETRRLQAGDVVRFGTIWLTAGDEADRNSTEPLSTMRMDDQFVAPMRAAPAAAPPPYAPVPSPVPSAMVPVMPAVVQPYPYAYPSRPSKDRSLAVILELMPSLFGFMGFGWMYADQIPLGIALLLGYWVFLCLSYVIGAVTVVSLFCTVPISVAAVGLSAFMLYNQTKKRPDLFGP